MRSNLSILLILSLYSIEEAIIEPLIRRFHIHLVFGCCFEVIVKISVRTFLMRIRTSTQLEALK